MPEEPVEDLLQDENVSAAGESGPSESQDDTAGTAAESVDALKKEINGQKEKYLRLYAEFENFKKRSAKERLDFIKVAGQDIMRELLPVLDDFQRAEKAFAQDQNTENYAGGVKLIFEKFQKTLQQKGLKPVDSIGKEFNIEFHEAIAEVPAPSDELKGKIIDEVECGYTLNDTVIRYAKVVVGK